MTASVRFAPSPTGRLHVGNIRGALMNFLFARHVGGSFLLRLDDTDTERSTEQFAKGIAEDLNWLGLVHDRFARQSDRIADYDAASAKLKASGRLYPCYETPGELDRRRKMQEQRRLPPVYDRAALKLSDAERAALDAQGRKPHWRFKLTQSDVKWRDRVHGDIVINTATVSDPVLIREDGRYLYTLPSVVDDIDFAITHVIRGEDHVTNTATQIEIFEALGAKVPSFAHYPLLVGVGGEGLSKRTGSMSIASLRDEGIEAMAINSLLAKLGTSDAALPRIHLDGLIAEFDLDKVGRAPAHFDPAELRAMNAKLLHATPYASVAARLAALGVGDDEKFWNAVRGNLETLADARDWWSVVHDRLAPAAVDRTVADAAADLLPADVTEEIWSPWTKAIAERTGKKGKDLFHPLRLALTGRERGPELKTLLPLIGRERALARLRGQEA